MVVNEITAKSILTASRIPGYNYCVNPYVGCQHGCTFCYARFMARFTGHRQPWGHFVDIKVNAAQVLGGQLAKAKPGIVGLGTVTDPYQPLEEDRLVTRACLEVLLESHFPVSVLTRSPLCSRDIDLFGRFKHIEVGLSVTTDNDRVRAIFEPNAPPIQSRLSALQALSHNGIRTYAFVGPILPLNPGRLTKMLSGIVNHVLIDKLNYGKYVAMLYSRHKLEKYSRPGYAFSTALELKSRFEQSGIDATILFPCPSVSIAPERI